MPYLTPDTHPTTTVCRVLFIPDNREWLAIVAGALEELTFPRNFEAYGAISPDETAAAFTDIFDNFCFDIGTCRMIGEIIAFAGTTSPYPAKWLACDGSSILRADYPDLFNVIGTTYGSVDGTHFSLPDLQGRSPSGAGAGAGLSSVSVGQMYGEESHTLITSEMPGHTHIDGGHTHTESTAVASVVTAGAGAPVPSSIPGAGITGVGNANISNTGGDGAHNTVGPRLGINYLIVALD